MEIRPVKAEEIAPACELVMRCFNAFIAPGYSLAGCQEFTSFADPAAMRERIAKSSFVLAAINEDMIIGMIEIRGQYHVALFDVDPDHQRQGIGRRLMDAAIERCRQFRPNLERITVNSAPGAVVVYQRLGFIATAAEQETNGIRYVPMELILV
ncbi:MAG: GNAT family N-acetyltransferase [Deltaproteobacteria bacterium]